jgi:CRISPR-associated protein Csm5
MSDWFERHALKLIPLSPIHVGTGEPLDWTQSVIDANGKRILLFDGARLPPALQKKVDAYSQKILVHNVDVVKFIREFQAEMRKSIPDIARAGGEQIAVLPALSGALNEKTGSGRVNNENRRTAIQSLQIARCMTEPRSGRAYVPGSSVKGAMRTAWADEKDPGIASRARFHEDPFSRVMLEDFQLETTSATVVVSGRCAKRSDPTRGRPELSVQVEVIRPGTDTILEGGIRFRRGDPVAGVVEPLELFKLTHAFHLAHWNAQRSQLEPHVAKWWWDAMQALVDDLAAGRHPTVALVRLGRYGTAESKTTRRRSIKVRISRTNSENRPAGTTFWLADDSGNGGAVPFGWALLAAADIESPCLVALREGFEKNAPWSSVNGVKYAVEGASGSQLAEVQGASSRSHPFIEDLETRLAEKKLTVDWLKAQARDAAKLESPEDRQLVKKWISDHLVSSKSVVPSYRRAEFTSLLQAIN